MSVSTSVIESATTETTPTTTTGAKDTFEWTLRVWRSADRVITTDSNEARRQAYEDAVGEVMAQLGDCATTADLSNTFWSERLSMLSGAASIRPDGRVLNTQVVSAAACWRRLARLMA